MLAELGAFGELPVHISIKWSEMALFEVPTEDSEVLCVRKKGWKEEEEKRGILLC